MKQTLTMDQLKDMVKEVVQAQVKDLGLTRVERVAMHPVLPTSDDLMGRTVITPEKREAISNFFRGIFFPEARGTQVGGLGGPFWAPEKLKDMSVSSDAAGGYFVPREFRDMVIMALEKRPVVRNLCSVFPVTAKDEIPRVAAKPAAAWGSENVDFGSSVDPTLDNVLLTTNLLKIITKTSRKLVSNSRVDIVALLVQLFAEAFGKAENDAFTGGNGTGRPRGFRNGEADDATVTAVAQAAAALAGDDLINLYHAVPSQYRAGAVWMMPDAVIAKVRKLKESTTGNYLWTTGLAGAPATILGRPVLENEHIPTNLGTASPTPNESEIWFGDFRFYYIGDEETMSVEATTVGGTAFASHQLHIKAWESLDAKMALKDAFRYLSGVK